jgi:uncharacterized protein YoxC
MDANVALLLTIVSVLTGWAFLGLLVLGLLLITKPLDSVRVNLQKIAMGVRAIEKQLSPLGDEAEQVAEAFPKLAAQLDGAADKLARAARGVHAARRG